MSRLQPRLLATAAVAIAAALAGCSTAPKGPNPSARSGSAPSWERDGAEDKVPEGLDRVADATPKVEPIRTGGPNKTYEVMGVSYTPQADDRPLKQRGLASWYGRKFHGRRTASGEVYDMYAMTAAHKTMPLPSYARVKNLRNGREVVVRVNDRGPFHSDRVIDLSYTAALKLGLLRGVSMVEVERLTNEDIRTGAWQREGAPGPGPDAPAPAVAEAKAEPATTLDASLAKPVSTNPPADDATRAATGYWLQLGAFRQREGAEQFQQRVSEDAAWLAPQLALVSDAGAMHKLQAGPFASREEALATVARVRESLKLVPVIVERR